ncbi:Ankyrin repeat-containing domain,Ankyrin repeat, partial [Cinara cedri]
MFSYLKKEKSVRSKDNKYLNDALTYAMESLKTDIVKLLVNAGADVNLLDKNKRNAIIHAVERLAISRNLILDPSKNLPEEMISHPIIEFLLGKGSEYDHTDEINTKKNHKTPCKTRKKDIDPLLQGSNLSSSIREKSKTQDKSSKQEPIYAKVDLDTKRRAREQKASETQGKSLEQEPTYAKVDFAAKRMAREQLAEDKKSKPVIVSIHFKDGRYVSLNHNPPLIPKDADNISNDSDFSAEEPYKPQQSVKNEILKTPPVTDIPCCKKGLVQERINHFKQLNEQAQKIEHKTRLTQITHRTART